MTGRLIVQVLKKESNFKSTGDEVAELGFCQIRDWFSIF